MSAELDNNIFDYKTPQSLNFTIENDPETLPINLGKERVVETERGMDK